MEKKVTNNITIEGARLIFRNFSGEKSKYNSDRTFDVVLEEELAKKLKADGWKVDFLEPRNEDEEGLWHIKVKVYFSEDRSRWPQIVVISGGTKKRLGPKNVNVLDWASFENVDVCIRPYNYDFGGKTGVKAYVKSLWVTLRDDDMEMKDRDIPYADGGDDDEDEALPFN